MRDTAVGGRRAAQRARKILAASVLLAAALAAGGFAAMSRQPLRPLRTFARWSLEWRGARFLPAEHARLQLSLNDCGPTALADLLELSGRAAPPSDSLRRLTATTAMGTSIDRLAAAAAVVGLEVVRLQWDPGDVRQLPLPSLVWVERNHFVVVARRDRSDSLEIHDPAAGRYRMSAARFERLWSGDALVPLDSMTPHRKPDGRSGMRSLRPRGTRAIRSRTTEV